MEFCLTAASYTKLLTPEHLPKLGGLEDLRCVCAEERREAEEEEMREEDSKDSRSCCNSKHNTDAFCVPSII